MIKINNKQIGKNFPPYIIAELSANHGGSIERAKSAIRIAKRSGANAIKIQTYTPETMTIKCDKQDFKIKSGIWNGYNLFDLYKEAYTPYEWHEELFRYAENIGITIFSTPFDETAVELLEYLKTPAYKIASFELLDLPLIKLIAKKNKPIFLSTGMASLAEINDAIEEIRNTGNNQILLFHCISSYPAPTDQSNLNNIVHLANEFNCDVGLSDHSINNIASTVSIGLGAVAFEKHFQVDNNLKSVDSAFSLLPKEFSHFVKNCNNAWLALGEKKFKRSFLEEQNKTFRRSLYFVNNLKKGSVIREKDIRRIRPGYGLSPKFYNEIIGKVISKNVNFGDPVTWDCFKK